MRFSSLARWIIVLGILAWAGYTLAGAGWSYLATQEVVDKVLLETTNRYRSALSTGTPTGTIANYVRSSIVAYARRDGLVIQEADIQVFASAVGISVAVRWSYPLVTQGGRDLLVIPMSIQRSIAPAAQ